MQNVILLPGLVLGLLFSAAGVICGQEIPKESDFYKLESYEIPEGVNLEAGGLHFYGEKLAVSSRRGDVYLVENPLADDLKQAKFKLFASGLHEVLGLTERDGWLYATQRCEVSRLKDEDGDGRVSPATITSTRSGRSSTRTATCGSSSA